MVYVVAVCGGGSGMLALDDHANNNVRAQLQTFVGLLSWTYVVHALTA